MNVQLQHTLTKYSVETMRLYTHTGGHKMFKSIMNFLTAFQKARVAAHFARMGDYKAAQSIYRD